VVSSAQVSGQSCGQAPRMVWVVMGCIASDRMTLNDKGTTPCH